MVCELRGLGAPAVSVFAVAQPVRGDMVQASAARGCCKNAGCPLSAHISLHWSASLPQTLGSAVLGCFSVLPSPG